MARASRFRACTTASISEAENLKLSAASALAGSAMTGCCAMTGVVVQSINAMAHRPRIRIGDFILILLAA